MLICAVVVFIIVNPRFIQPSNLSLILQQVSIVGAFAAGQTLIILTAGIDLSVGAIMILAAKVAGTLAGHAGVPG